MNIGLVLAIMQYKFNLHMHIDLRLEYIFGHIGLRLELFFEMWPKVRNFVWHFGLGLKFSVAFSLMVGTFFNEMTGGWSHGAIWLFWYSVIGSYNPKCGTK